MDKYNAIEMDQDGIELAKLIRTICQLKDEYKQYAMDAVETDKQLYLFYHAPYQ